MTLTDTLTIAAIIIGPVVSVAITLWWQRRKEKHDAKMNLFLTLMAHRKSWPPTPQWVDSLNMIDVVYADQTKVVELWHRYYELLCTDPDSFRQDRQHTYLLLLSQMARSLGYRSLELTDIDKFYSPQAHGDRHWLEETIRTEMLRILQNTESLATVPCSAQPSDDQEEVVSKPKKRQKAK